MTDMAHGTRFSETELAKIAADNATSSREDEAAEWSFDDGAQATGTATMSLRLPVSMIAALKAAAEQEGVGATVLARRWIAQRLAGSVLRSGSVDVEELLAFVGEHARG